VANLKSKQRTQADRPGLRFGILGSGSRGNTALIECGRTLLMLDSGFSARETAMRFERHDRDYRHLDAILITHEHSDHCRGVASCARRFGVPVWMTAGTYAAIKDQFDATMDVRLINPHERFAIGDVEVHPFPVPHDAREPCQFAFSDGNSRLGFLTDIGSITAHVVDMLRDCDALVLECNHDARMLRDGPYPPSLKTRIAGEHGHLENAAAARLLSQILSPRLRYVAAAHLSETNNTPALARAALARAMDCEPEWIDVAEQDEGLAFYNISEVWV
jgi:phosphoribosyl 1,2-cyclic phosphodiesterase